MEIEKIRKGIDELRKKGEVPNNFNEIHEKIY